MPRSTTAHTTVVQNESGIDSTWLLSATTIVPGSALSRAMAWNAVRSRPIAAAATIP